MSQIRVLPTEVAAQIAAGEVVERPASAVKELIENSIDAEASRCEVSIAGGGITKLVVEDNGVGMTREDAELSVVRHATSKLENIESLERVNTFGFRGEALPSIASVSRFRLVTRSRQSEAATEVLIEAGITQEVRPTSGPEGTLIEVSDLFFNVPARRKFLRSSGTESAQVAEVVDAMALAAPQVTLLLRRDGRLVREWLRVHSRAERVYQLFESRKLKRLEGERGPLRMEAFLSPPEEARVGAQGLRLVVNGRVVRDRALAATVAQAYGSVLERGRYPKGVVFIDLDVRLLDVNVHPQKAEVRFAEPRAVTDAVYQMLSRSLGSAFGPTGSPVYPASASRTWAGFEGPVGESHDTGKLPPTSLADDRAHAESGPFGEPEVLVGVTDQSAAFRDGTARAHSERVSDRPLQPYGWFARPKPEFLSDRVAKRINQEPSFNAASIASGQEGVLVLEDRERSGDPSGPSRDELKWSELRFIAQLKRSFLLCEGPSGLYVLDQHAAAERVAFARLRQGYLARNLASQTLLFPVTVEVAPREADQVSHFEAELVRAGFDVKVAGDRSVAIHAIPKLLERVAPERLFGDLLGELTKVSGRSFSDLVDLAFATMACHGALRAGDLVSYPEAIALLEALDGAEFASHCPHGRPVVAVMTFAELERKVGRR